MHDAIDDFDLSDFWNGLDSLASDLAQFVAFPKLGGRIGAARADTTGIDLTALSRQLEHCGKLSQYDFNTHYLIAPCAAYAVALASMASEIAGAAPLVRPATSMSHDAGIRVATPIRR